VLQKVNGHLMFTDAMYSFGKKFVQVYLPAISSLYFGLGNIWGFPAIEQVVGSCAVVATFIGVCLGISSKNFDASEAGFGGEIKVGTSEKGKKVYSLELKGDPAEIEQYGAITFKVVPHE